MIKAIEISTNIGCKNMCSYCPQKQTIQAYKKVSNNTMMSFEVFKKCINKVPKSFTINFSGLSEPWLNPSTTDMVIYARWNRHLVNVYTTLVGISKNDVLRLKDINLSSITIHLPNKSEYFMRKKKYLDILDFVCNNIDGINFIYFDSIDKDIISLTSSYGYDILCGKLVSRSGLLYDTKHIRGYGFCPLYINLHILLPNGSLILCCMDFSLKHIIGNLLVDSYKDIINSKKYKDIKKSLRMDDSFDVICRNCEFFIPFFSPRFFAHIVVKSLKKLGYNYYKE